MYASVAVCRYVGNGMRRDCMIRSSALIRKVGKICWIGRTRKAATATPVPQANTDAIIQDWYFLYFNPKEMYFDACFRLAILDLSAFGAIAAQAKWVVDGNRCDEVLRDAEREVVFSDPGAVDFGGRVWPHGWRAG